MIRDMNALSLARLAAGAIRATAASAASAEPIFRAEAEKTTLTSSQGQVGKHIDLRLRRNEMQSRQIRWNTATGNVHDKMFTTLTLKPTYEECKIAAENAKVTASGGYLFHFGETQKPSKQN